MKICVADDESEVRLSIIQKIRSVAPEAEVYDVGFGLSALKGINAVVPDVAFLDIRMPEMNGLELLAEVRRNHPQVKLVMLTGYQEFEYARQALQLGASDFLLKPADRDHLKRIVREASAELNQSFLEDMEACRPWLDASFLAMEGLECRRADCWFDSSVMKRIRFWQREAESLSREESEEAICVFNVRSDTAAAVLIAKRSIPGTFAGREEFREAFLREWDKWESARFFGDTPSRPRLPSSAASLALQQIRTELLVLSRAFDLGRLKAKLSEWAAIVSQLELKLLRKECALLMGLLEEGFVHSDTVLMLEEDKIQYWLSWVRQFRTWTDLVARIRELIAEATRALKELKEEAALGGGIVEQAMAHIRKSSYSDLSLENVASAIGVHPVTLSRMFKQKIGVNFVQYLTRHRLEHARQMLISSNKTVREIAEEIGYSDYRYFCSLFKKESGFLPREYRNLD